MYSKLLVIWILPDENVCVCSIGGFDVLMFGIVKSQEDGLLKLCRNSQSRTAGLD